MPTGGDIAPLRVWGAPQNACPMRLFLLALLSGVLAACSKSDDLKTAALKVEIHYEGFRPGCVTLTVTDQAEVSRHVTTNVNVPTGPAPGTLSVAVFRQAGWTNDVKLLAAAKEQNCDGAQVVTSEATASLAKDGVTPVSLSLSALDKDGDGFVAPGSGGTDCNDDDPAVLGPKPWYDDADGDKYGSRLLPPSTLSCTAPSFNSASNADDCDDRDSQVHPGQEERCNGRDDNCDGKVDEPFNVGGACDDAFQCRGTIACSNGGTTCGNTPPPTAYFRDEDGDGKAGADGGMTCGPPPPGTVAQSSDCDESSVYVAVGTTEVCDRLDNNCDGRVDESGICGPGGLNWEGSSGGAGQPNWRAIAVGADLAWLAGNDTSNNVLKIQANALTPSTCAGSWNAAWISSDGQLFLAGESGKLASKTTSQSDCTPTTVPGDAVSLNGLVGFNAKDGSPLTLYAVASNGHIFRWLPPAAPVDIATTGINLRAIHAAAGPETMLAVGAKDFQVTDPLARVVRFNPADGTWPEETLPATVPSTYLTGVSVVNANYAYAVGNKGILLERDHGVWRQLASAPLEVNLTDVIAFGKKAVYVTTAPATGRSIQFFNGTSWETVKTGLSAMRSIDGTSPTQLGASGDLGVYQFFRWPK